MCVGMCACVCLWVSVLFKTKHECTQFTLFGTLMIIKKTVNTDRILYKTVNYVQVSFLKVSFLTSFKNCHC